MDTLPEDDFHPLIEVDAVVSLDELTLSAVESLDRLAPFGQENPTPRYLARNVRLTGCRAVGAGKNHLSCALTDGVATVSGIMFHCDGIESLMACGSVVDAAFQVQIDEWRGRRSVKCMLDVIEPASPCPALRACLPDEEMDFLGELYEADRDAESSCGCQGRAAQVGGAGGLGDEGEGARANAGAGDGARDAGAIAHMGAAADAPARECGCERAARRAQWEELLARDPGAFEGKLIEAFIGGGRLHDSQRRALDALGRGQNVLAVMGTGRGKSLIFQAHAVRCAIARNQASVFVYPLRALLSDQRFHLSTALERFGLSVAALCGETAPDERRRVYAGLAEGSMDVVLTTPEYLVIHAREIAACGRVGFLAIDEAHHMLQSGAGKRAAYTRLREVSAMMGDPRVLAVTATAPCEVASAVRDVLPIDCVVTDDHMRANLMLDDRRSMRDKDSYLASIIASGEKTAVYVNSRMGTVDLARTLRALVPQVAMQVGFYNAGLTRDERERIERLFREGVLRVLVCTSAFGEGVDIPDIRHVVLYGMPFSDIEFNQISGRAGRNGAQACIHLLFGKRDVMDNEGILRMSAPTHDAMALIYRELKRMQREAEAFVAGGGLADRRLDGHGPGAAEAAAGMTAGAGARRGASGLGPSSGTGANARAGASGSGALAGADPAVSVHGGEVFFTISDDDLACACRARAPRLEVERRACACGIAVFEELGLVRVLAGGRAGDAGARTVHVCACADKVELSDSVRYREGLGDIDEFARFREWAMRSSADALRGRIVRPILPDEA